jgi:hypothetical protein|nr:MAG TPA: hypothetical protein [Caudoviricetes sp.]
MALVGTWGLNLIFRVSAKRVLTFKDFSRTVTAKWVSHDTVSGKPVKEFLGTDSEQLSMKIHLTAALGINVGRTIKMIENAISKGTANYLVIGGRRVGNNKFVISKMSEKWERVYKKGQIYEATLTLTFLEYT